jgi:hypothetical protein
MVPASRRDTHGAATGEARGLLRRRMTTFL